MTRSGNRRDLFCFGGLLTPFLRCVVLTCLGFSGMAPAHASVAVLLEQPYGGLAVVSPMGHAAIYLDNVCAETPVQLRPCRAGELGVVVSRYDGVAGYDWIAIPLVPYLYGVSRADEVPPTADRRLEAQLRDAYRRKYLQAVAPDLPDGKAPGGNWYELVGSAYDRTLFGFQVDSSAEQDERLIALFNDAHNVERYNGVLRNCADFSRLTINLFYPHAVRRNFIADFGITTPKSVARALDHYGRRHPEVHLRHFVVRQVPGEIPRSREVQGISEGLLKRYAVPIVLVSPISTGALLVAYVGEGRLTMPRGAPLLDVGRLEAKAEAMQAATAEAEGSLAAQAQVARNLAEAEAGSVINEVDAVPDPPLPSPLEDGATVLPAGDVAFR